MASSSSQAPPGSSVTEYIVKIPKVKNRVYHVMKFNKSLNIDYTKWTGAKMEREDNAKQFMRPEDEGPQSGAGSEFGKAAKEEARRKKLGINAKKYRVEDQPWMLRAGGKTGKRFKGIREGGICANTSYYIFTQGAGDVFEARPVNEWYNFHPINRYKTLNAEEAEEQFEKRNTIVNYFSVMLKKRLKPEDEAGAEAQDKKSKKKSRKGDDEMKISEMDDWVNSSDDSDSDNEDEDGGGKGKGKNKGAKKKKKKDSDDEQSEPEEDSDDGDREEREVDYITDSSTSEEDEGVKGVDQEDALRKLLSSDEDEEEEKKEEEKKEEENTEEKKDEKKKKKKKKKKKEEPKAEKASSDSSDNSSDMEVDAEAKNSRASTPVDGGKRKAEDLPDQASPKKPKIEASATYSPGEGGITEDAVRRYLMRKPMTTVELCQKFKNKKTGLNRDQLVQTIALILKRVNPIKQHIKGKLYLSLKR